MKLDNQTGSLYSLQQLGESVPYDDIPTLVTEQPYYEVMIAIVYDEVTARIMHHSWITGDYDIARLLHNIGLEVILMG